MMIMSESDLVAGVRTGDERACEQLVRTYGGRMLGVAKRLLRCEQDAEDAVQEAFVSALRGIENFDGDSQLGTWLHRIGVNACLMKLRSKARRPEVGIDDLLPSFDRSGHHVGGVRPWGEGPVDSASSAEMKERIRACIDRLPESYRTVLMLRDIEEMDTAETAKVLSCSEANVKTRLHRARQALRKLLEPMFVET